VAPVPAPARVRGVPRESGPVADIVRGEVTVTERDAHGGSLAVTGVQLPGVLDDLYAKAATVTLGPTFDPGRVTLRVWAPTAHSVELEFEDSIVHMRRDDRTGVWSASGRWKGATTGTG
jgi:hypothetical protein